MKIIRQNEKDDNGKSDVKKNHKKRIYRYVLYFVVPSVLGAAATVYSLRENTNNINMLQEEIKGAKYLQELHEISESLTKGFKHDLEEDLYGSHDSNFIEAKEKQKALEIIDNLLKVKETKYYNVTENLKSIKNIITEKYPNEDGLEANYMQTYEILFREIFACANMVSKISTLVLDSQIETYYLQSLSVDTLPQINRNLNIIAYLLRQKTKNEKQEKEGFYELHIITLQSMKNALDNVKSFDKVFFHYKTNKEYIASNINITKLVASLENYVFSAFNILESGQNIETVSWHMQESASIMNAALTMQREIDLLLIYFLEKRISDQYFNFWLATALMAIAVSALLIFMVKLYKVNLSLDEMNKKNYETNNLLNGILNAVPVWVYWKDRDLQYMGCNKAFAEKIELKSPKEITGKTDDQLKWANNYENSIKTDKRVLESGKESTNYEESIKLKNDEKIWLQSTKTPLVDKEKNIYGILGTHIDITNRKTIENELARAYQQMQRRAQELIEANEELSQYAYVVSHDLKSPLRAIHNYADFLSEDLKDSLDGDQKVYLEKMSEAVQQSEDLVNDLLEFSRVGRKETGIEKLEMRTFFENLIRSLNFPKEVEIKIEDKLPALEAEPLLLKQVFQNLIINGVKFNKSKNKIIDIGLKSEKNGHCEIFVKDNGIGIAPKYQQQIFKVFQRLHTQKEYEGTGIGLAIVKKAVEKLGGSLYLESVPEEGSTFYVTLLKKQREMEKTYEQ
ncbi:MAG: ATP-binding protein [Spirochaetia bacterium]|nr:ATP-binding protein [Spirochaetia bacterium]